MKPIHTAISLLVAASQASAVDASGLRAAAEYSATNRGTVLLVQERGKTVFAEAANGGSLAKAGKIYSGTKMFWILAALAAAQDGLLTLDERVGETISEWDDGTARSRVTIRQLLNFTSGIEPNFALHGDGIADRNALAISTRFGTAPGGSFIYGPAALQVFHEVLKRKLVPHGETPTAFLERQVLRPLGLKWKDGTDASVIPCPGCEEQIECGQNFEVMVERAETPLRLEHVLRSVRRRVRGHIYVVFGAKASHPTEQRSGFGHVIGRFADGVWITTDDPAGHSPSHLAEEIAFAWRQVRPESAHRQPDRSLAIRSALWRCRLGDALVVAGKGAETFNILADTVVPFDDREECLDCLNRLGFGAGAAVQAVIE